MSADQLLQGLHIAVTRPLDQAQSLCKGIEQHGGVAIEFPLIAVSALENYQRFEQQITQLPDTDWAIFISSNAVDFAMPRVLKKYDQLPEQLKFAAIGQQTAHALTQYGVSKVLIPQNRYDSETLLALPEMQNVAGNTIAIFRGVGGRELMAETLKARGAHVYFAESYQQPRQLGLKVLVAEAPGDEAMLQCLSQLVNSKHVESQRVKHHD
jgi:uroporphyrinogen-III synthase